jgi:hypothetical protein
MDAAAIAEAPVEVMNFPPQHGTGRRVNKRA